MGLVIYLAAPTQSCTRFVVTLLMVKKTSSMTALDLQRLSWAIEHSHSQSIFYHAPPGDLPRARV